MDPVFDSDPQLYTPYVGQFSSSARVGRAMASVLKDARVILLYQCFFAVVQSFEQVELLAEFARS